MPPAHDTTPRVIDSTPHVWPCLTSREIENEEWRPVPGLEGEYEASNLGRIRSLDRELPWFAARWGVWTTRKYRGQLIVKKVKPNGSGQPYQHVYTTGGVWRGTNRMVCAAFHGPAPTESHEAAHLNGNSLDDRADNLAWKTPSENARDKVGHGTAPIGTRNGKAIASEDMILPIFSHFVGAGSAVETAEAFGLGVASVRSILQRRVWTHVAVPRELVDLARRRSVENIRAASRRANQERREQAVLKRTSCR